MVSEALKNLDPVQLSAVTITEGPVVVFAGAGSGKTRIITSRIAYLLEKGVSPGEILAVTFTNKAAREMKERIENLTPRAGSMLVSTFHSACCRWCREFGSRLGYDSNFSIFDEQESKAALKVVVSEFSSHPEDILEELYSFIQRSKTKGLTPLDIEDRSSYLRDQIPQLGIKIYQKYQEYLSLCNAMDFGDLILNVLILLRRDLFVADVLEKRYRYILVDEYQDTNASQIELITRLASRHKNIFVVGDDDQSIYSWRGAEASNILEFNSVFKDARVIVMDRNYRSSACIVEAAGALISHNITRAEKNLHSQIKSDELISFYKVSDDESEAKRVVRSIYEEKNIYPYNNVAIFYRTNSQSRLIEDELCYQGIPYQLYGALKFYERAEIKDIISYLKLMVNSSDNMSLKRIINTPTRGIGVVSVKKVEQLAIKKGCSMMEVIRSCGSEFSKSVSDKLKSFYKLIEDIRYLFSNKDIGIVQALKNMLEMIDYSGFLKKKYPTNYLDKMDNVYELISSVGRFVSKGEDVSISDWLQSVLVSEENPSSTLDGVSIMTLHMAKGLEFDRVYIIGLEEGILPHRNNLEGVALEEERRLMYVGMTRAKKKLSLYSASQRFRFNYYMYNDVSRFIEEIPKKYIQVISDENESFFSYQTGSRKKEYFEDEKYLDYSSSEKEDRKDSSFSDTYYVDIDNNEAMCYEGQPVYHNVYGKGIIEKVVGGWGTQKLVVNFLNYGSRKLRLKDVKLL